MRKKQRNITKDIEPVITSLQSANLIGDKIKNIPNFFVYKARARNSSAQKGKSGGYRIIYYLQMKNVIYILSIYSKSDHTNISSKEITDIINRI